MVVRLTPASLDDGMPINAWQRLRNLQLSGQAREVDGAAPMRLTDDQPMDQWLWLRNHQARGLPPERRGGAPVQAVALSAAQAPTNVSTKAQPARGPLTGRPGEAALITGALNTIASGPNTSAPIRVKFFEGAVTRGTGRDIHAEGRLGIARVGARGVLDPPSGRAEISASGISSQGIGLPPRVRVYTTPTGKPDPPRRK